MGIAQEVRELLWHSEQELEKNSVSSAVVGNKPNCPMLLLFNKSFKQGEFGVVENRIRRIWLQALQYIIKCSYSFNDDEMELSLLPDGAKLGQTSDILSQIDTVLMKGDAFVDMRQWRVYNIIDTSDIKSVDEFMRCYELHSSIEKLGLGSWRSMLIVLLDDSATHRSLVREIKEQLSRLADYNSTIIISNRARDNSMCEMETLYRIAVNSIILSNNADRTSVDNGAYTRRAGILYSGKPLLVSYILRESPNRKIAAQIYNKLFEIVAGRIEEARCTDSFWTDQIISISNDCDSSLGRITSIDDTLPLRHLPFKVGAVFEDENLLMARYSSIKPNLYEDAFDAFISAYAKNQLALINISQFVEQFKRSILGNVSSAELSRLTDEKIDALFNQTELTVGTASDDKTFSAFFAEKLKQRIKQTIVFPAYKRTLRELKNAAIQNISIFRTLREELNNYISISSDYDWRIYQSRTENFCLSDSFSEICKRVLLNPESDAKTVCDGFLSCFKEILNNNEDLFRVSFIDAWARRAGNAGSELYHMISREITEDSDSKIRLNGSYPIDFKLKVLMLHTLGADGLRPTELYGYLKATFEDDPDIQFFNTGWDDSLEAMFFSSCERRNIVL